MLLAKNDVEKQIDEGKLKRTHLPFSTHNTQPLKKEKRIVYCDTIITVFWVAPPSLPGISSRKSPPPAPRYKQ